MALSEKLQEIRASHGLSQKAFAAKIGVPFRTYQTLEQGDTTRMTAEAMAALAEMGVDLYQLVGVSGTISAREEPVKPVSAYDLTTEDLDDYVKVNRYPVEVDAGPGATATAENMEPLDQLSFRRDWLVGARGLNPKDVALVFIRGDSMYPTLWSGDLVMVDTTRKGIHGGGLYVIRMGEELMAKRLQRVGADKVRVTSDNAEVYQPFEVAAGDIEVVGEIVWYCRDLR